MSGDHQIFAKASLHGVGKRIADTSPSWSPVEGITGLDVGRLLCTNRIRLRDGLRQLEMCIPFQGKMVG